MLSTRIVWMFWNTDMKGQLLKNEDTMLQGHRPIIHRPYFLGFKFYCKVKLFYKVPEHTLQVIDINKLKLLSLNLFMTVYFTFRLFICRKFIYLFLHESARIDFIQSLTKKFMKFLCFCNAVVAFILQSFSLFVKFFYWLLQQNIFCEIFKCLNSIKGQRSTIFIINKISNEILKYQLDNLVHVEWISVKY